jgi:hypothetical protein
MPLTGFLQGEKFDRETVRVMSIAFEMTRIALGFRDGIGDEIIAKKLLNLPRPVRSTPIGFATGHLSRLPRRTFMGDKLNPESRYSERRGAGNQRS